MMYETDTALDPDLQKTGCALEALAHFDPDVTDQRVNQVAEAAHAAAIIDEDDTIQDWQKLVELFGYPLEYRDGHFPSTTPVDTSSMYLIAEWFNPNTNFHHFVVMDGKGVGRDNVAYDPIQGGSRTVREGYFLSYRIFDKTPAQGGQE